MTIAEQAEIRAAAAMENFIVIVLIDCASDLRWGVSCEEPEPTYLYYRSISTFALFSAFLN